MQTLDTLEAQVRLIRSESERVEGLVDSLPPPALNRPSPCEKWNVGEVVAHLIWFAETYGGMMERGLQGDQSPPEGFPRVPGTLSGVESEELYGQGAIHKRRVLGQDLSAGFRQTYDWLNKMLRGIGPEDWDKLCYHTHRFRTVESFLPTIVQELAIHEWDIRSTLEASPVLSGPCIPVLMEKIPGGRRPWSLPFPTGPTSPRSIRYRFQLTGPEAGARDIIVKGVKATLEASSGDTADLCLSGATDSFIMLMYGRLRLASSISSGQFWAEGRTDLVSVFDEWLDGH